MKTLLLLRAWFWEWQHFKRWERWYSASAIYGAGASITRTAGAACNEARKRMCAAYDDFRGIESHTKWATVAPLRASHLPDRIVAMQRQAFGNHERARTGADREMK